MSPPPNGSQPVTPVLVHTFDGFAMGIVETEPDIFYVSTVDQATLERFDMRGWVPGAPAKPTRVLTFDQPAGLNGACLLAPRVILLADSLAGLIWRVDLADDGLTATASVWLHHHTMAPDPDNGFTSPLGPQPGINGIRFAARTNVVYYTSSAQKLFMRVAVDPATHTPVGQPEVVAADITADDFCLDENAGVAYLTTHTDNTIVRVPIDAGGDGATTQRRGGGPLQRTTRRTLKRGLGARARRLRPYRLRDHRRRPHGHRVPPPGQRRNHPPRTRRAGAVRPRKARTMSAGDCPSTRQRTGLHWFTPLTPPPTNAFPTDRSN